MNAARAYRRLKEVEEQKLANRLALLKLELAKSQKKIDETKKRTETILSHRSTIEDRHKRKIQEQRRRETEQAAHQEIIYAARSRMDMLRRANVLDVQKTKKDEARKVMAEMLTNRKHIQMQKQLELRRAVEVKNLIRQQRLEGKESREQEMARRHKAARDDFNRRVKDEAVRSKESEKRVSQMEQEELKLIRMLEDTQENQRTAYSELESALTVSRRAILKTSRASLNTVDSGRRRGRSRTSRTSSTRSAPTNQGWNSARGTQEYDYSQPPQQPQGDQQWYGEGQDEQYYEEEDYGGEAYEPDNTFVTQQSEGLPPQSSSEQGTFQPAANA